MVFQSPYVFLASEDFFLEYFLIHSGAQHTMPNPKQLVPPRPLDSQQVMQL